MRCARYGPVVLSDATHTADVRVVPVSVGTGYHLLLPLNGHVVLARGAIRARGSS